MGIGALELVRMGVYGCGGRSAQTRVRYQNAERAAHATPQRRRDPSTAQLLSELRQRKKR